MLVCVLSSAFSSALLVLYWCSFSVLSARQPPETSLGGAVAHTRPSKTEWAHFAARLTWAHSARAHSFGVKAKTEAEAEQNGTLQTIDHHQRQQNGPSPLARPSGQLSSQKASQKVSQKAKQKA